MEAIKFIQSFSNPFWDRFFQLITMMGEELAFFAVGTLFLWCVNKEFGYKLGLAFISGAVVNFALKEIFHVPRPIGEHGIRSLRLDTAVSYSFPSGHAQNAATFWTQIMIKYRNKTVIAAGIIFILLVGLSRVYLGVHTPADAVGGIIIGIGWAFASNLLLDFSGRTGKNAILLAFIIPMLAGMIFLDGEYYFRASGGLTGIIAGYLVEVNYIRHQVNTAWWKRIIKYVLGISVLVAIRVFLKNMLPDTSLSHFLRYFLMGIWVTALAPYMFMLLLERQGAGNRLTLGGS